MPLHDLLTPQLLSQLGLVRQAALEIWHSPQHRHYTDHKPESHSERIIEKLNAMSERMETPLREVEAFILLCAAYLHDIGMQMRPSAGMTLDEVRDQHHLLSREMIEGAIVAPGRFRSVGLTREFTDEVALVSAAHRKLNLASPDFETRPKSGQDVRLRLLSAMLRLADALDLDDRRVIMDNLQLEEVSSTSRLHWWRCHYVEGVAIREGIIRVTCAVPSEDYAYYIRASIENEVRAEVEKTRPFLWPDIKLAVGDVTSRVSATKYPMSASDFDSLRAQVRHEMEVSSQANNERILEMRSREERAAQEAAAEGHRSSGSDPPRSLELLQQAARLFHRLGQPHAVVAQLERISKIYETREQWNEFAASKEELGHLYLVLEEPFNAKNAFHDAQDKTILNDTWAMNETQIRRGLNCVAARMLWGEFDGLRPYLDEVAYELESRNSVILPLFYGVKMQFHECLNQWQEACGWARRLMSLVEANSVGTDKEARIATAGYEMSLIASLAGEHELAFEWIRHAFTDCEKRVAEDHALFQEDVTMLVLHARRGFLFWRIGRRGCAMKDFFEAVRRAEKIGDEAAILIQLENAHTVANERLTARTHPFLQERSAQMRDLQRELGELRGLPSDGGEDRLADNLSATLIALQKALTRNDVRGLARARVALARIYARSGRPSEALSLFVVAGGGSKEIPSTVKALVKKSEADVGPFLRTLSEETGVTDAELIALGTIIKQAADYLPDDAVEPLVNRFLQRLAPSRTSDSVICALLPAIGQLAPRISNALVERTARLALDLLSDRPMRRFTVRSEAAKVASDLATGRPIGETVETRLPYEVRSQLIERLTALTEDEGMGREALMGLVDIGLMTHLQTSGDVHQTNEEEQLRVQVLDTVRSLVLEKRQVVASQLYVSAELGPIPDKFDRAILLHFSKQAEDEWEMAQTSRFNFSAHPTSLAGLKSFARLVRPGVLSAEEATHFFERLLELANHPDNVVTHRETAFYSFGHLAKGLAELQEAGDIPNDFLARVATTASDLLSAPNLGVMIQMMADGATDPLNRFKSDMGKEGNFQGTILRTLGRIVPYLDPNAMERALETILRAVGHKEAEVRDGAAYAFLQAHPGLNKAQRREGVTQLYALLHDGDFDVRSTALFALDVYGDDVTPDLAVPLLRRIVALSVAPDPGVRRNSAYLLQRWAGHPIFASESIFIHSRLDEMQKDVSYEVRDAATRCLLKLQNSNKSSTDEIEGINSAPLAPSIAQEKPEADLLIH